VAEPNLTSVSTSACWHDVDGRFDRSIWRRVASERDNAHAKHGATSMESMPSDDPTGRRLRILLEEVGEVAKEFNDAEHEGRDVNLGLLMKELIQVAAMAGAWADACDDALRARFVAAGVEEAPRART
jgi:hypothetical protein